MKLNNVHYILLLTCFVLVACNHKKVPDVSDIHVKPVIERLDIALMQADTVHIDSTLHQLNRRFPVFFDFYLSEISFIGHPLDTNPRVLGGFRQFLSNQYTRELFDSIRRCLKESDITNLDNAFTDVCRYYKYYFPKASVPKIIMYADGFSYGAVSVSDSVVGLPDEMYLGENFSIYKRLPEPMPRYETRLCRPEYMARNAISDILSANFPYDEDGRSMLDIMVHNGKLLYALMQVMPYTSDTITTQFSQKQLEFCEKNESEFWKFFVKENILYSRNSKEFGKYVHPGPECVTPNCQPYNLGTWVGLRIIEKFMDTHSNITLPMLMSMDNAQAILQQSGYKP